MKPQKILIDIIFNIAVILLILLFISLSPTYIFATSGINRTINFQGKIVNKNGGTNIPDNPYSFTFKFYDAPTNGNQLPTGTPWSETQSISVTDGIFRATLGSSTPIPAGLNFDDDSIYLDITFNGETFGSRVRMTAVPYAFNAEKVGGLTVTNTTGTLTIPNGKTIQFADAFTTSGAYPLTLTVSNTTNATLPTGTITLADLTTAQILTNKTIGSTGLVFSGAATDISTLSNEDFTIVPNGTGRVGIGTTVPSKMLDVVGSATISGDITMGGQLQVGRFNADPIQTGVGSIYYNTVSNKFRCYINNAWADCDTTGAPGGGENYWSISSANGTISPMNTTVDFLLGATATNSAKIALTNIFSGNPTASLAGNLALTSPTGVNPATTYNIFNGGSFNLQTSVGGNAGLASRLFINNSGNIGVGTTTPGALLQLSSSQVGSTLLDVVFNGSSAFTVTDTGIINNLPTSFNSPGDVSIAYDINFTNPTASYIKSAAPLYIQAGETFNSSDLNLMTYNKGNVIVTSEAFSVVGSATVSAALNVGTNATVAGTFALAPQVQQYAGVCNATNAGKMYYDASQNSYYFCNASTWTQVGSGTPGGSGDNYWTLSSTNGTLSPMNTTVDLLLGGTATSSARIGLINVFSGVPSATFSGNLAIEVPTGANAATVYDVYNGASINFRTSVGGETGVTSRLFIANNGNIGIGDSNPTDKLDVAGNASIAGNLVLDNGARTIAGRAYNPLTIGDSETGNLLLSPKGSLSGIVQVGTGGAGTNTPDMLALDVKSDGADPVGFEGAIYYNTNTNKFRCFEGSAWANCIAGSLTDTDKITFLPWSACNMTGVTNCTVSGIGCVATTNMTALGQKGGIFRVDMDVYNNVIVRYNGALASAQSGTVTVNLRNYTAGSNTVTTSFNSGTTCADRSSASTDVSALSGVVSFGLQIGDSTTTDDPLLSGVVVEFSK